MGKNILILIIVFLASLAFLIWISYKYYSGFQTYAAYSDYIDHTNEVITEILNLENYLKDAETGQRGFLLTGDSLFLEPLMIFGRQINPTFQKLRVLTKDNPAHQKYLDSLVLIINERNQKLLDVITIFRRDDKIDMASMTDGRVLMKDSRALLQKMKDEETRLLRLRSRGREDYKDLTTNYSIIVGSLVLFILVTSFLIILRELKERLVYQRSLEEKINELDQTTSELEQIGYVSSHDLQEPLRKIRTFSDIFFLKFSNTIPKDGLMIIERIHKSSIRMQGLVEDLMKLTNMGVIREPLESVQLNEIVNGVVYEKQKSLETYNISVNIVNDLPVIPGSPKNLKTLFDCLIDNAVKFSKDCDAPTITIFSTEPRATEIEKKLNRKLVEKNYVCVTIQDNGIGFENEYAKKIFILFQRLHQQESTYEGKGIGLTIVKRIMANHQGFVVAEGAPNKGATFHLYFPKTMQ